MGDSRTHGDQGLPWLEAANDENGTRRDLAAKMLWTLFALLLISSVAVVPMLPVAVRGRSRLNQGARLCTVARQEPDDAARHRAADCFPSARPGGGPAGRPTARLRANTMTATAVADRQDTKQPVIPAIKSASPGVSPSFARRAGCAPHAGR
jgi:hypothetical protein